MKKHPVVTTIAVILLIAAVCAVLYRRIPFLQLQVRHGLGTEVVTRIETGDGIDLFLTRNKKGFYLDAYVLAERHWGGLSPDYVYDGGWKEMIISCCVSVENGIMIWADYTVIARETEGEPFTGEMDVDEYRARVEKASRKGTDYQIGIARLEYRILPGKTHTALTWEKLRDAILEKENR